MNPPTLGGRNRSAVFKERCYSPDQSPTTTPMERQVPAIMLMADSMSVQFRSGIYSKGDYLKPDNDPLVNNDIKQMKAGLDLKGSTNGGFWKAGRIIRKFLKIF